MNQSLFNDTSVEKSFSDHEKLARLRLIRTENIGPITFKKLISRFGTAEKALSALPDMAARGGKKTFTAFETSLALSEIEKVEKFGAELLFMGDIKYPTLLAEIDDAPPVICVLGDIEMLHKNALGIVGARNASLAGRKLSERFASSIGQAGYIIASGLARGIDQAVHKSSLQTGTIAVVAGGIDVIYPSENADLYHAIRDQGVIVAESPLGVEPIARHFPKRNRIISGLSQGVLVIEAAHKSGSLITARMALEQNRDVFAIPGSPLDARAGGTNALLRDGAIIATTPEDVIEVLNSLRLKPLSDSGSHTFDHSGMPAPDITPTQDVYDKIESALSHVPIDIDFMIRTLDIPTAHVLTALLEMEIAGKITRSAGNKVNLA